MKKKQIRKKSNDDDYKIYTQNNNRHRKTKKNLTSGSWTIKQNEIYLKFLQAHQEMLETKIARQTSQVFRKMSAKLKRRNPQQCRTHHQKLLQRYDNSIPTIMQMLREKINKSKELLQNTLQNSNKEQPLQTFKKDVNQIPTNQHSSLIFRSYQIIEKNVNDILILISLDQVLEW